MNPIRTLFGCLSISLLLAGCGPQPTEPVKKDKAKDDKPKDADKKHDHTGWWCEEHGVVEAECSVCQKDVFKKLKKDEICPNHPDRAKAQCFICNPELWEKSKAVYKAKTGEEAPVPEANKPEKK
jgi:hypothetical protein